MILNFKLENGAFAPKNEHSLDAGYDLISPVDLKIKPKKRGFINTGVCVQATNIPKGFKFEGKIEGTSGNAKKKGLYPIGGIIDQGYRGNIGVVLVNNSFKTIKIKNNGDNNINANPLAKTSNPRFIARYPTRPLTFDGSSFTFLTSCAII